MDKNKKATIHVIEEKIHNDRIYQYSDGKYLPEASQPSNLTSYEISSEKYTPHSSTRYTNVVIGTNGIAKYLKNGLLCDCNKSLPNLYQRREECCGCTACFSICSSGAIKMKPDEEGFEYPVVNAEMCIRCYRCIDVCPIKHKK